MQWTITGLDQAFRERDLPACQTALERQCATVIHGKEVRERATRVAATRSLTPGELAIAEAYGWSYREGAPAQHAAGLTPSP